MSFGWKFCSVFGVGIIGSLIASGIYWFILVASRPQIGIFPRIVKNYSDELHYIVLYHTMKRYCRKKAIDLKVTAILYGKTSEQSYNLYIPLYANEFPVFEAMEPWNEGKREHFMEIPMKPKSKEFLIDVLGQVELMGKLDSVQVKELIELTKLKPKQWYETPQGRFAACFEKLFPYIYERIIISVNYQDAFSGIRNTKTIYINNFMKENLDEYENWRMLSKKLNGG